MSNSNFNITKVIVDPTSQEITNLEVNGKAFESGSETKLEHIIYGENNPLSVGSIFGDKPDAVEIYPHEGYDGIELVTIDHIAGYPAPLDIILGQFHTTGEDDKVLAFYSIEGGQGITWFAENIDLNRPILVPNISNGRKWQEESLTVTINQENGSVTVTINNVDWVAEDSCLFLMRLWSEDIIYL